MVLPVQTQKNLAKNQRLQHFCSYNTCVVCMYVVGIVLSWNIEDIFSDHADLKM